MQSCAVVGCGAAGMAAAAALRQSGMLVTCFELAGEAGGVWSSPPHDPFTPRGLLSPLYPAMRSDTPKDMLCFSDVRFDYAVPQFPHHSAIRAYLARYAARKGIAGMTRFNTKVESIRWNASESVWRLVSVNVPSGDAMLWRFDAVCVCVGQTHKPRYPAGLRERLGLCREGVSGAPSALWHDGGGCTTSESNPPGMPATMAECHPVCAGVTSDNHDRDANVGPVRTVHHDDDTIAADKGHSGANTIGTGSANTLRDRAEHLTNAIVPSVWTRRAPPTSRAGEDTDSCTSDTTVNTVRANRAHVDGVPWDDRRWSGECHHACHVKNFRPWRNQRVVVVSDYCGDTMSRASWMQWVTSVAAAAVCEGDAWGRAYCEELHRAGAKVIYSAGNTDDVCLFGHRGGRDLCATHPPARRPTSSSSSASSASVPLAGVGCAETSAWTRAGQALSYCRRSEQTRVGGCWMDHSYPHSHPPLPPYHCGSIRQLGPILRPSSPHRGDGGGLVLAEYVGDEAGEVMIDDVAAIICVTGYWTQFPFLPPDIRAELEEHETTMALCPPPRRPESGASPVAPDGPFCLSRPTRSTWMTTTTRTTTAAHVDACGCGAAAESPGQSARNGSARIAHGATRNEPSEPVRVAAKSTDAQAAVAESEAAKSVAADAMPPPLSLFDARDCRGLYLGTVYMGNPTLAFVGRQPQLWPPFLLFEAQSRFIAFAFTQRAPLPSSRAAMVGRQAELLRRHAALRGALCDCFRPRVRATGGGDAVRAAGEGSCRRGGGGGGATVVSMAHDSAVYFDVLQSELGVSSRERYRACLWQRRRWLLWSLALRGIHRLRAMAPLKRKKQHLLFDNAI